MDASTTSAKLHFEASERTRDVSHYHGCSSSPDVDVMSKLENAFDRIVQRDRWVGTRKERSDLAR